MQKPAISAHRSSGVNEKLKFDGKHIWQVLRNLNYASCRAQEYNKPEDLLFNALILTYSHNK
jgi:hypothetical protein